MLDYQDRLVELNQNCNPFAVVVKAHLKMQETKRDKPQRKAWKLQLIQELYEAGYNRDTVVNLFKFLDWVLVLPKRLDEQFWLELKAYEEERRMPYITSVERIGYERGRKEGHQEGRQEGRQEERRSLTLLQLEQKLGQLPQTLSDRIAALSLEQLQELAISLLSFNSLDELTDWLEPH